MGVHRQASRLATATAAVTVSAKQAEISPQQGRQVPEVCACVAAKPLLCTLGWTIPQCRLKPLL